MAVAGMLTALFDPLLIFGENRLQTIVVLSFYLYCIIVLVAPAGHRLFHLISIPVFSQFLHLYQKYDFPAGANSLWRLLPFVLVDMHLLILLAQFRIRLSIAEQCVFVSWIVLHVLFIGISPNLAATIGGAFLLFLITLPAYFAALSILSHAPAFRAELEKCLFILFVILALGTFGLVFAGMRYKDADNLLVTRNISDTNVTMAYFILLWPFVLLYLKRRGNPLLLTILMVMLFAAVVILSFSRGAVFIVAPYLAASLFIGNGKVRLIWLAMLGGMLCFFLDELVSLANVDVAYPWQLRFGELHSVGPAWEKWQEASGRLDIHRVAWQLFLKSPLYGHGIASFEVLGPGYREAHSLLFTSLAEQGLAGTCYLYGLFVALGYGMFQKARFDSGSWLLLLSLAAYLVFVHSVGSVFVIIPAKSLTINCIAPILLICMYHYSQSVNSD
ncbi:hypothetical protein GCM10010967_53030 [Dyadobacter beijingensis]|uniref:O-antigen ligase-related domain-containing protein n=2 Tax=Dyadobacter beijingensis TaxID=365489 RepID=A0ABQ2IJP6_9BACT|nr:hypothetical protein GCM10010967_53030 [Dyadobacter beijingensis]